MTHTHPRRPQPRTVRRPAAWRDADLYRQKICRVCGASSPRAGWKNCGGCPACVARVREKKLAATAGCPACDGSGTAVLQWRQGGAGSARAAKYRAFIRPQRNLRFGTLHACTRCAALWVLDLHKRYMRLVLKRRRELFTTWCTRPQVLPRPLLRRALAIGAVRYDEFAYVPCRVTTRDGVTHAHALLSFQAEPPIDDWRKNLRLATDIRDLQLSPQALPLPVRTATTDFWDAPYGGALAATPAGAYVHVQPGAQFVTLAGVEAADLRLVRHPERRPPGTRIRQASNRLQSCQIFVVDWIRELGRC